MEAPSEDLQVDPGSLTDQELKAVHERLADWLEQALSLPPEQGPDDELYDRVHDVLSEVSSERADRQREDREGPPRTYPA